MPLMESKSVHYKNFAALLLFKTILKQLNFKWTYAVRATTRSGYVMTSPTFAKWRPRRETRGKVTAGFLLRLEVSFPHTSLRAVTLDNEKSGVWRKNAVRWTFVRSWEVKRPNTRVFQLKEMPTRPKTSKKEGEFQFSDPWKNVFEIYIKVSCAVHVLVFIVTPCLFMLSCSRMEKQKCLVFEAKRCRRFVRGEP